MESTEKQVKTTASDSLIFKCDICGNDCCSRCEGRNQYWNGFLCNSCYNSFHIRSTTRMKKINKKREIRNQYPAFSFELKSPKQLKIISRGLESLCKEGTLSITQNGIEFHNCDDARFCFSRFKYPKAELIALITPRKLQQTPLNLTHFSNALESLIDTDHVIFQRKPGEKDITINSKATNKLITINPLESIDQPDGSSLFEIKYPVSFLIEKSKFIEILSDCKNFSKDNLFSIECTEKKISFTSEGETTNYNYTFTSEELENYRFEEDTTQLYIFDDLLNFLERINEIIDTIKLSVRKGYPLKVDINNGQGFFILAPRRPREEEED